MRRAVVCGLVAATIGMVVLGTALMTSMQEESTAANHLKT
jgi:hypothetical protein